ncbi:hypothetical protein T492DRAFT_95513 [Pavlovales sp. CCMP2436]|nr:hypothetical protein T492DRAFT_95513 [Pavlovales sp. CCMP2436]
MRRRAGELLHLCLCPCPLPLLYSRAVVAGTLLLCHYFRSYYFRSSSDLPSDSWRLHVQSSRYTTDFAVWGGGGGNLSTMLVAFGLVAIACAVEQVYHYLCPCL